MRRLRARALAQEQLHHRHVQAVVDQERGGLGIEPCAHQPPPLAELDQRGQALDRQLLDAVVALPDLGIAPS